jgi:hypothetical protein
MKRVLKVAGAVLGLMSVLAGPAGADPVGAGSASAFAASVSVGGEEVVAPIPLARATMPPDAEDDPDPGPVVDVPADPIAVSGTLDAKAVVHAPSDVASELTVVEQEVEGPYNAQGVALVEGLQVLLDAAGEGVPLVSAAVVRAEAVAVCRGGSVSYSANSEIIDLDVGGEDIPLNTPVTDLIDAIAGVLDESGLSAVVDVDRNVVTELDGGGIAVDALVISVVADAGPLALVTIGHAEVAGAGCSAVPQCSDGVDNADPEDTVADADDPGCHTDGDAANAATYDPNDDDETDAAALPQTLPRTGGALDAGMLTASALGSLGFGLHLLRRRATAGI